MAEKVLKEFTYDGYGVVVEVAKRDDQGNNIAKTYVRQEVTDKLRSDLDAEIKRATEAESTLQENIDTLTSNAVLDDEVEIDDNNLIKEITIAGDKKKIVAERAINDENGNNIVDTYSTIVENDETNAKLAQEIERAKAAESEITKNLNAEINRATSAEAALGNDIDAETARATSAETLLTNNLNAEIERAKTAEGVLQTNIDSEVRNRESAIDTITTSLNNEIKRSTDMDNQHSADLSTLSNNLQRETDRASQAEENLHTELTTQIGLEREARINADDTLSDRIERLEGKTTRLYYGEGTLSSPTATEIQTFVTNQEVNPPYAPPYSGIAVVVYLTDEKTYHIWHYYTNLAAWKDDGIDTVTTFTNTTKGIIQGSSNEGYISADNGLGKVNGFSELKEQVGSNYDALNTKIEEETARATGVEESLRNDLNTEVSRAKAAEEKLTTDLTAEKTRAEAAEQELDEKITAETTRATEAEETLQANIDAEETRATQAETTLTTNLNKEIQDRTNADTALKTNIENGTIVANKATNDSDGNPINTTYVKVEGFKTNYLDSNNVMYKDDIQAVDSDLSEDKVLNGLNINGETYNIARVAQNRYQHINILSFTNIPDTYTNWRTSISGNMNEPEDSLVFAGSFSNIPENINIYQSVIFDPVLTMGNNCGEIERSLLIGNITSGCNFTYNGGSSSSNRIEESIILSPAFRAEIDNTIATAGNIFHSVYIALDQYQSERQDNLIPVKTLWSSIVIGVPSWREEYEEGYNYRYAVLIGTDGYTLGNNTVTIGYSTRTYKPFDIAIGCRASTSDETGSMNNLAIGVYTNFVGQCVQCVALGYNTKALASKNHIYFDSIDNDRTVVISDLSHILFRNDDITDSTTSINDFPNKKTLQDYFDAKQDTLTAGAGISIADNTISCTVSSPITATDVVMDL